MKYRIDGTSMEHLEIGLAPGESINSETGCLLYMTPNIEMTTNFQGGIGGMLKRAFTGNSIALNTFTAHDYGKLSFSTRMPGRIVPLELERGRDMHVQRHSYLCSEPSVNLEVATSFNLSGLFGGNGLIFNRLSGHGQAFISVDGDIKDMVLEPGETLLIHPGHLAAHESSVHLEMQRLRGFKNFFFSGEDLAFLRVTGPGRIIMHTLNLPHLAMMLYEYMPKSSN